ncbi:hypothetical protein HZB07_07415 [Candidatus Saganbacteria bacterium]|nr:hypothetical protein [Candidatus Saganbacteria bacterium]
METEVVYPFENLMQDYVELRENLARNGSVRRKDFDNMMQGILSTQDKKEKEVKTLVSDYFNEQKQITQTLKEKLEGFKESLARGDAQRVQEFQAFIKEIISGQERRREETTGKLREFQKEQEVMSEKLKELLAKGRNLRARDFKLMLVGLGSQKEARLTRQEERREEVRGILASARKYKKGGK